MTSRYSPATAVLLVLMLVLTTLASSASFAGTDDGPPNAPVHVPLNGTWRFSLGDDLAWAAPDFDDTGWETRIAPQEGGQDDFDATNSLAWFRRTFHLDSAAEGQDLWLSFGVVDDAEEIYINGQLAAGSGSLPPEPATAFFWQRLYDLDESLLRFGEPNSIAVRLNDSGGGGGITAGPLGIMSRDVVADIVFGTPYTRGDTALAEGLLATQQSAIAAGDVTAYLATLAPSYEHSGFDAERERDRLERLVAAHGSVSRSDELLGAGLAPDGTLIAEVRRTWAAADGTALPEAPGDAHTPRTGPDATLTFIHINPATGLEIGDHSRLFRDFVASQVSDANRPFDVYLPPSYHTQPERRFPSVYLLHGAGGNNTEWEIKQIKTRLDALVDAGAIEEMIVIMPWGKSDDDVNTWYVDSSTEMWRTMFFTEMLPLVDATYRTIDDREARGISGWSMGGQGAFTVGWDAPDVFGSIASLSGALSFPPIAGTAADTAANAGEAPLVKINTIDPLTLASYCYFLYAGEDDDFAFDDATRAMMAALASRAVVVPAEIKPSPAFHADHVQLPGLAPSFILHSQAFAAHGEDGSCGYTVPANQAPTPADDTVEAATTGVTLLDVLANDTDPDHDPLRFGPEITVDIGELTDNGDGRLRYVGDGSGEVATGTYEVIDGRGLAVTATITIEPQEMPSYVHLPLTDESGGDGVAIALSQLRAPEGQSTGSVLLASERVAADSIASGSLQADHPLLLTDPAVLEPSVLVELQRLGADRVVILGGPAAVSDDVEAALIEAGLEVERLAGDSRLETAAAIAASAAPDGIVQAFLARAFGPLDGGDPTASFADSLAAGAWAAEIGVPILLTQTETLSPAAAASLDGAAQVTLVGGPEAVSADVESSVLAGGAMVDRVDGPDRFATAIAIAEARGFGPGSPATRLMVVDGTHPLSWSAGFAMAGLAADTAAPIVLVGADVPDVTRAFLEDAVALDSAEAAMICAASTTVCDQVADLLAAG